MRRLLIIAIVALIGTVPMTGYAQTRATTNTTASAKPSETAYPYVVGLGAIAGIVATQYVLFGGAGFPFWTGNVAGPVPAVISVGVSRMYAITSAVTGALIANWAYDH
ncbi:MAG: hypothetical protein WCK65_07305 [Rhodospirillaceae bacterium]